MKNNHNCISNNSYNEDNQTNNENTVNSWNIIGLLNEDKVSCYANSTIQSLLHCITLRKYMQCYIEQDCVKTIYSSYIINNIHILSFRKLINDVYASQRQQDVPAFIIDVLKKSNLLNFVIKHKIITKISCTLCEYERTNITDNIIIILAIPQLTQSQSLQDIINYNLNNWTSLDSECNQCKGKLQKKLM